MHSFRSGSDNDHVTFGGRSIHPKRISLQSVFKDCQTGICLLVVCANRYWMSQAKAMKNGKAVEYLGSILGKRLRLHTTDTRVFVGEFKCTDKVSRPKADHPWQLTDRRGAISSFLKPMSTDHRVPVLWKRLQQTPMHKSHQ